MERRRISSGSNSMNSAAEFANNLNFDSEMESTVNSVNTEWNSEYSGDTTELTKGELLLNSFTKSDDTSGKQRKTKFRKMYIAALVALVNALCMGFGATYTATALDDMTSRNGSLINPTREQKGWIGSTLAIGALFGGLIAGNLAQTFGRRYTLLFSCIPFIGGWLTIAFAQSVGFLYCGRIIVGFCCGIVSVTTPMYLVEISTPEVRGLLGASFQLFVTVGVLLASCFGAILHWNWLAAMGAALSGIAMVAMFFIPESPRWLMAKKKGTVHAAKSIQWLQGDFVDSSNLCKSIQEDIDNQPQGKITFKELLIPDVYKPALLSFALMFFQQGSGVNAILFYTVSIFKKSKSSIKGVVATILIAIAQVIATLLSSVLMDKAGRKPLLLVSGVFMALSFGIFGCFDFLAIEINEEYRQIYGWVPVLCLITFISAFSLGFGPIPWLMVSEMTTARLRSITSGVSTTLNWTFVFAVTNSYHALSEAMNDFGVYWLFMSISIISCIFTIFLLPETKGKTLEEIQGYFKSKKTDSVPMNTKPDHPNLDKV